MSTVAEAPMLEALRRERNRFVAFAFAAADLVLEVGPDGAIDYAAGAGKDVLGIDTGRLIGVDFFGLLAAMSEAMDRDDAEALQAVLSRNIFDGATGPHVVALAEYLMAEDKALAAQPGAAITGGALIFEAAA